MLRSLRKILWSLPVVAGAVFSLPAFADTPVITNAAGVHSQICNVFAAVFWVLITVSIIMVLWAGYLYVTAQDDMEQVSTAKKTLFYAALGILAGFLARLSSGCRKYFLAERHTGMLRACLIFKPMCYNGFI